MEDNCINCGTKDIPFVLFTQSNGGKRVRKQCLNCGHSDPKVYKHNLFENIFALPLFDPDLRNNFIETQFRNRDLRKEIGAKDYYNDVYLKSEEWKSKRLNILKRDNFKCVCCNQAANVVHHITYSHVYCEKSNQLISLCNDCHNEVHFGKTVHMGGLIANFGILKSCQSCGKYHNGEQNLSCDVCVNANSLN